MLLQRLCLSVWQGDLSMGLNPSSTTNYYMALEDDLASVSLSFPIHKVEVIVVSTL